MTGKSAQEIDDAAADWAARLDRHATSGTIEAELDRWLASDARHAGALLRAEAALRLLDSPISYLHAHPAAAAEQPETIEGDPPRLSRRAWLALGGGGALAASIAGALFWLPPGEDYVTRIGEIRRVPISDGSVATINSQSQVRVALTAKRRTVQLASGEAWFQVAHDTQRPFVVEAGAVRVQAVGTAFAVRREAEGAEVLVTEGVVEVWCEGSMLQPTRLRAGQRAFVTNRTGVLREADAPDAVNRALAWRSGEIDLAGETLGRAVTEFNRYNIKKLEVRDPRLAREPLFGTFRVDDPEGFANAVASGFDVRLTETRDGIRIGE